MMLTFTDYDEEDEGEDEEEEDDDDDKPRIGAMPQRLPKIKSKVKPMPLANSFFIFSSTNKCAAAGEISP